MRNPSLFGSAFRDQSVGTKDDGFRKNSTHPTAETPRAQLASFNFLNKLICAAGSNVDRFASAMLSETPLISSIFPRGREGGVPGWIRGVEKLRRLTFAATAL
jgi:hypothetical protein